MIRSVPRSLRVRGPASILALAAGLALVCSILPARPASGAGEHRLPARPLRWSEAAELPAGAAVEDDDLVRQGLYQERWRQVHQLLGGRNVSRRSGRWLADHGLGPARLGDPFAKATAEDITLRILLVRISFEENRLPDLVTMAADGDFFLDPHDPADPLPIDPTPHDKAYFEAHLRGLAEYYRFQSGGRLTIESRVLPEGERDSYKLVDVADYGPGAEGWWTLEGLERLVRDMIEAADTGTQADQSADLSDYADDRELTYIIFAHAGSDWQSDINQDTPNDIPTFFVTLGEPQTLLGGGLLSECSVIPETTTQDGYRGSIAAALYHEFGHALGLPDVYDASTGLTSCGVWDLMDSGTNLAAVLGYEDPSGSGEILAEAVTGLLPPSLSAWCRWFLGWVDAAVVRGGEAQTYKLPAAGVLREHYAMHNTVEGNAFDPEGPQVLLGGASPREFFLIENRWVPRSVADTPYDPFDPQTNWGGLYFLRDPGTGVVLYLAGDRRGEAGLNTGYYDYFLPEGGLLIWHVNMDRIEASLATNTINRFGDGLKLVEADGIQDIGVLDSYVQGWYGSARDPFAPWNDAGYLELFAEGAGVPGSRAFDRSWTGLRLWGIADDGQAHGAVMSLQAVVEPLQAGWPVDLPPGGTPQEPRPRALAADSLTPLAGGGRPPLLAALAATQPQDPPLLFIWDEAGQAAYPAPEGLPVGAAAALPAAATGPPAVLPLADGSPLLVLGLADGSVQAHEPLRSELNHRWTVSVGDSLLLGPQPVPLADGSWRLLVVDERGRAHLLDRQGQPTGEPVAVSADGIIEPVIPTRIVPLADGPAVLVGHAGGWRVLPVTAEGIGADGPSWSGTLPLPAQVAVVPAADASLLLVYGPGGLQGAWRVPADGQAAAVSWRDPGSDLVCEPAVADLDGDGGLDVIAATATHLFAWQADGVAVTGFPVALAHLFPLPEATRIAGPLIVADLAAGPGNEVAFATDRGHLLVIGAGGRLAAATPYRFGDDGPSGLAVAPRGSNRAGLLLATAGGRAGPPLDRRLTHGRLAVYGDRPLPDTGPATAGWFGAGGGPRRGGPVGEAQVVGDGAADDPQREGVVFFPNPLRTGPLVARFWSAGDQDAELAIYNLQGEVVHKAPLQVRDGLNEHAVDLDVASGLYVARLTWERDAGRKTSQVRTLAVTR